VVAEKEPNNTVAVVQPVVLTAGARAVVVEGAIVPEGDVDMFRLVVPDDGGKGAGGGGAGGAGGGGAGGHGGAGGGGGPGPALRLSIELLPQGGLAPRLQALDIEGRALATSSAEPGERDGLPNLMVRPGAELFLRVADATFPKKRGGGDSGAAAGGARPGASGYRLTASLAEFQGGEEQEANGTAAAATDLGPAVASPEAAGYLGWRRDEDWYRLDLEGVAPEGVLLVDVEAVEGVVSAIAVHDAAGARHAYVVGRRGRRVSLRAALPPPRAAPVGGGGDAAAGRGQGTGEPWRCFVVVRAESGRNLDRPYVLSARVVREESAGDPDAGSAGARPGE
jgi:hypothetical protein